MGYLNNNTITVDAILTKRGRELLARNDGSFKITQFALSDDEIDYTLFNENHPNGSQYAGEAIENMALIEALPDENNMMLHKLITLPRGTSKLPIVSANISKVQLTIGATMRLDRRLLNAFTGVGGSGLGTGTKTTSTYTSTAISETVVGNSFSLTAINSTSLFGTNTKLLTTITIEGRSSGARTTIPVEISKEVIATKSAQGESGIQLA